MVFKGAAFEGVYFNLFREHAFINVVCWLIGGGRAIEQEWQQLKRSNAQDQV